MAEKTKNLCAQIPESLHNKVRQRQEESGQSLSAYMTDLITKFFEMEGKTMEETLKKLYEEVVPEPVREFVDAKAGGKPKRPAPPPKSKPDPKPKTEPRKEATPHELP